MLAIDRRENVWTGARILRLMHVGKTLFKSL
jgi:hypothetical protein